MRRWTLLSRAERGGVILSGAWTTSICYKPREIERRLQPLFGGTGQHQLVPLELQLSHRDRDVVLGHAQETPDAHNRIGYCFLRGNDQILHLADLFVAAVV